MSVTLVAIPSYVEAVNKSSLKKRSQLDYLNCLKSKLHSIEGSTVKFRTYIDDTCEYWEFTFSRKPKGVEYLYISYGYE